MYSTVYLIGKFIEIYIRKYIHLDGKLIEEILRK